MAKKNSRRHRRREEWVYKNFEAILALPERLASYLRLWFHLPKAEWDFAIDKMRQKKAYREWSKSKGRGKGRRYFAAPCAELKLVQRAVLNRFLSQITVHFCRHGGQLGSSIMTNVGHHAGFAKTVFAVDIVNAFPSVYRSRVRACLRKPFNFGLRQFAGVAFSEDDQKQMLESVVDLMILKDRLPQGPPTSPRLFDIVCGKMDQELFELIQTNSTPFQSYRISVWLDNITISSDGDIPEELRAKVAETIRDNGFFVHTRDDKMKYFSPETGEVPVITGLVIGEGGVTMAPRKVNQLRGRLTRLCRLAEWDAQMRGEVAGILGFVRQVYPHGGRRLPSKLREIVEMAETRFGKKVLLAVATKTPAVRKKRSRKGVAEKPAPKTIRKSPGPSSSREIMSLSEAIVA